MKSFSESLVGGCSSDAVICLPADGDAAVYGLLTTRKKMIQRSGKFTYTKIILLPAREIPLSEGMIIPLLSKLSELLRAEENSVISEFVAYQHSPFLSQCWQNNNGG